MIHIDRHHPQASIKSFYQEPSSVAFNDIKVQLLIHSDSDCLLSFTHVHEYLRNNVALQGQGQEELGRTGITWTECLPAPSLGLSMLPSAPLIPAASRWLARFGDGWREQQIQAGAPTSLEAQAAVAFAAPLSLDQLPGTLLLLLLTIRCCMPFALGLILVSLGCWFLVQN